MDTFYVNVRTDSVQPYVYPNPVRDWVTFQTNPGAFDHYAVFDTWGRQMDTGTFTTFRNRVNCSNWPPGMYTLCFYGNNGRTVTRRLER
jgi:hypothetical protein